MNWGGGHIARYGDLEVLCWCESEIGPVSPELVRQGQTWSCCFLCFTRYAERCRRRAS